MKRPGFWRETDRRRLTIVVYTAIGSHIDRVGGGAVESLRYPREYPKYRIEGDTALYDGTLGNYSRTKLFYTPLIVALRLSRLAPVRMIGRDTDELPQHLAWIREEVARNVPAAEFYLVLHPGRYGEELVATYGDTLGARAGFEVIDARQVFPLTEPYILHPLDDHLSAVGNARLGDHIATQVAARSTLLQGCTPDQPSDRIGTRSLSVASVSQIRGIRSAMP